MKKRLTLLILLALVLAITSSLVVSGAGPTPITIILPGDRPMDMDELIIALENKFAKDVAPIKLTINFYPFPDYQQKLNLILSTNQPADLIFCPAWEGFYSFESQKAFRPLNDIIPKLSFYSNRKNVPDPVWRTVTVNGNIYGLSAIEHPYVLQCEIGLMITGDMQKKYAPKGIKTTKDVMEYIKAAKKDHPELLVFSDNPFKLESTPELITGKHGTWLSNYVDLNGFSETPYIVADASLPQGKKAPKLLVKPFLKEGYNDQEAGYIVRHMKGMWSDEKFSDDGRGVFRAGRSVGITGPAEAQMEHAPYFQDQGGLQFWRVNAKEKGILTRATGNWFCVGAKSPNPEIAAKFIDWLMVNRDNYELWAYGIKDKHYKITEKGTIEKIDPEKHRYDMIWWYVFNENNFRRDLSMAPDFVKWDQWRQDPNHYYVSPFIGWPIDTEPVKTEIAKVNAVMTEYKNAAIRDPKLWYPEYKKKLTDAGINKIVSVLQKQFDDWWVKNH